MNNIDKQYLKLIQDILDNGVKKQDRTGTGTLSVFGRQIRHKMSEGFPLLTTKKMYFKGVVTELLWFLRGDTNIKYLVDNDCHIWDGDCYKNYVKHWCEKNKSPEQLAPSQNDFINLIKTDDEFAKKWGELGPVYGKQWRSWDFYDFVDDEVHTIKIDQIAEAIHKLKTNPDDRGIIVSSWNVGEIGQMVLRPCHNFFQFYTRELSVDERFEWYNKRNEKKIGRSYIEDEASYHLDLNNLEIPTRAISLMFNMRSCDVPLGLPFNIASYALLLEIIGKMVNMIPDELISNLGDAHIYLNQIEGVKEQLTREPMKLSKLDIHPGILDYELNKLEVDMFKLVGYESHPPIKIPLSN